MQIKFSGLNKTTQAKSLSLSECSLSALLVASCLCAAASALPTSASAEDKLSLTGNAAVVSDYRYRGITQTRFGPALQVGADLGLPNGLYAGVWATNIKWIKDAGAKGSSEVDLYGGYKTEIAKDVVADVGLLRYQYLGNTLGKVPGFDNANTTEIYGALTYGPVTAKYSHALTSLFGFKDSSGSGYFDLSASFDMGSGWTLVPHLGRQRVANNSTADYTDYSIAITKDVSGILLGLSLIGVDAKDEMAYRADGKFAGKSAVVLSAKYNF